jgi:tRNA(His) guanylyltransferase
MSGTSALGDRMKRYEATTRSVLPRRTYSILRVDGRYLTRGEAMAVLDR